MEEFIMLIYAQGNTIKDLSQAQQQKHIEKVGNFIHSLAETGKLINAQPFQPEGVIVTKNNGLFKRNTLVAGKEDLQGYYHIKAKDMEEAVSLAESDPRFDDVEWKIEIRSIMKVDGIN